MAATTLTRRSVSRSRSRAEPVRMTEAEFVDWCDSDTWAEWKDGEVILMSPVRIIHGDLQGFLAHLLRSYTEEYDLGTVLTEPCQVRLAAQRRRRSPDIMFISKERSALLEEFQVNGAPDLIVEIVSPESQSRDRREKFLEYQAAGVREYWLVDPMSQTVEIYVLGKSKKYELVEEIDEKIPSTVLKGLYLKPAWLWQSSRPKVAALLHQMAKKL
jgi:Uma2 family endonuclease